MADAKLIITGDGSQAVQAIQNVGQAFNGLEQPMGEASDQVKLTWRDLWDDLTAKSHNSISDMGEGFKALGGTVADGLGDPLGTAKGLLNGMLDTMGPFGVGVAAIGAAVGIAGKALFDLGEQATETGVHIAGLALIMNESAAEASAMKFGYESVGGSIEGLTKLVFMFEQRMESSSSKVEAGLKNIGLSLKDLDGLDTPDKIALISDAMRKAGADVNIAGTAFEIFGKSARSEITELLGPLSEGINKSKELGAVWSDEDAKAALDFTRGLAAVKTQTESTWTVIGKDFEPISELFVAGWQRMKLAVANVAYDAEQLVTGFGYLRAAMDLLGVTTESTTPKLEAMELAAKKVKKAIDPEDGAAWHLANQQLKEYQEHAAGSIGPLQSSADAARELKTEIEEQQKIITKNLEAQKEWKKVTDDINSAGVSWRSTILGIDGAVVEWAEHLLDVGVNEAEVAKYYGLTEVQVKALMSELKDKKAWEDAAYKDQKALDAELTREHLVQIALVSEEEKKSAAARKRMMDERDRETLHSLTETNKLWREHYDFVDTRAMNSEQAQKRAVQLWFDDEVAKLKTDDLNWQAHYDALVLVAGDKMQKVTDAHDLTFQAVKRMQEDLSIGWQQHFADTLTKGNFSVTGFAKAFEGIFDTMKKDVEDIFSSMLSSIVKGFLQPLLDNVTSAATSISGMLISALTGQGGGGSAVSWASGGGSTASTSLLGGTLASIFGSGGAAGGLAIPGAEFSASTVYGSTAAAGTSGGVGGAIAGAAHATGSALGTAATFLATNPIGWAIDAGIGALLLWNHFSGPDEKELGGRAAESQWADDVWKGLSTAQRAQATKAGWSDPKQAGIMVWMDTMYANLGRPDPEKSAAAFYQNLIEAVPKGHSGVVSAIQDVQSFGTGDVVKGALGSPQAAIVHAGEGVFTPRQMAGLAPVGALAEKLDALGTRLDRHFDLFNSLVRTLPLQMRHAMRGNA